MSRAIIPQLAAASDPNEIEQMLSQLNAENIPNEIGQPLDEMFRRYCKRRARTHSPATITQYKRTITDFIDFADQIGVVNTNNVSALLADQYIAHLFDRFESDATILTYTKNIRAWLKWLYNRGLIEKSTYKLFNKKDLGLSPKARDDTISEDVIQDILNELHQKRRASPMTALLNLIWNTGIRIGGAQSLDVVDFDLESNTLHIRHRPESGTRLKNGNQDDGSEGDGERDVLLHPRVAEILNLYIQATRPNVTDEFGRDPLFATSYGRASTSTLRRWIYKATSCQWTSEQISDACDGTCNPDSDVCTYSYYPHAIRRGAIVSQLRNGLDMDDTVMRFNVSRSIIAKHYDTRSKSQLKEDRADAVKNAWPDF